MNRVNPIVITVFRDGGICRVHPPTIRADVWDDGRDEILFQAIGGDVLIVLPEGAVSEGGQLVRFPVIREHSEILINLVALPIAEGSYQTVLAGTEGVYRYVAACPGDRGVQSAVANSDPTIIIGRKP